MLDMHKMQAEVRSSCGREWAVAIAVCACAAAIPAAGRRGRHNGLTTTTTVLSEWCGCIASRRCALRMEQAECVATRLLAMRLWAWGERAACGTRVCGSCYPPGCVELHLRTEREGGRAAARKHTASGQSRGSRQGRGNADRRGGDGARPPPAEIWATATHTRCNDTTTQGEVHRHHAPAQTWSP